jgi:hypothetical protein
VACLTGALADAVRSFFRSMVALELRGREALFVAVIGSVGGVTARAVFLTRMIGGYGVTKGDIVVLVLCVLLLLVQPLVALALAVLWAVALVARRRWKN